MRLSDIPGLPARAAKALRDAGIETLEQASAYQGHVLESLKGMGPASMDVLREAGWTPGEHAVLPTKRGSERAAEEAEEVFAPPGNFVSGDHPAAVQLMDELLGRSRRYQLAEKILFQLAENHTISAALIAQAFDLAVVFDQEADRVADDPVILEDGLTVRFQGTDWTVRTGFKPGEAKPENLRTVGLVPVEL